MARKAAFMYLFLFFFLFFFSGKINYKLRVWKSASVVLIKWRLGIYECVRSIFPIRGNIRWPSRSIDISSCKYFLRVNWRFQRCRRQLKNRNIVNWITMTRKSVEHQRTIYGNTGQLFRPYEVSSAMYTVISTTGVRASDPRLQCRNSTTEPSVHIAHTWRQIN